MKLKAIFTAVITVLCFSSFTNDDCLTNFTITDCDNQPVANAVVTVERCKDKKLFSTVTNSKGQASFPLCKKEICKTRISQVGYNEKDIPKVGDNCNGDNCTIKICSE